MTETEIDFEAAVDRMELDLRPLVAGFEKTPLQNGRKMRELLNAHREAFPFAAVRIFRDSANERGCRYLVTILWIQDLLTSLFVDVSVPQPLCLAMAKTAAKVDPQFHLRLSGFLQRGMLESEDMSPNVATKILEILSATMEPAAIAPLLRKILLHPNGKVRSKATLLVGRSQTGINAVEKLLNDDDPRVRANAIEALWSHRDAHAIAIFAKALSDPNNRAIGNGIYGLYQAGSTQSIHAAINLAKHPDDLYRGTAAWVMGISGDPRFRPVLAKLLGESKGALRSATFGALQALKQAQSARTERLELTPFGFYSTGERSHLSVSVAGTLPGTAFAIFANEEPVGEYAVTPPDKTCAAVSFAIASSSGDGASGDSAGVKAALYAVKGLLDSKPETELWGIARYQLTPIQSKLTDPPDAGGQTAAHKPADVPETPLESFTAETSEIAQRLASGNADAVTPYDFLPALRALACASISGAGVRHLIGILDAAAAWNQEAANGFITDAKSHNCRLHIVSLAPHPSIRTVCGALDGSFTLSSSGTLAADLATLYGSLSQIYALGFNAPAVESEPTAELRLEVHTASASGSCRFHRAAAR